MEEWKPFMQARSPRISPWPPLNGILLHKDLTVEEDLKDALPFVNPAVIQMFEKMGFVPGHGLGKQNQGCRRFEMPAVQTNGAGLGYGWNNRTIANPGMREEFPGMNGWFVKEGEDFPYYGFSCEFHF
jgi:hypothetical protein